jgi:hypothetical protein
MPTAATPHANQPIKEGVLVNMTRINFSTSNHLYSHVLPLVGETSVTLQVCLIG